MLWSKLQSKHLTFLRDLPGFGLAGTINTLVTLAIVSALVQAGLSWPTAHVGSLALVMAPALFLYSKAFKVGFSGQLFLRFVPLYATLALGTSVFHFFPGHPFLLEILGMAFFSILNFLGLRYLVFRGLRSGPQVP